MAIIDAYTSIIKLLVRSIIRAGKKKFSSSASLYEHGIHAINTVFPEEILIDSNYQNAKTSSVISLKRPFMNE